MFEETQETQKSLANYAIPKLTSVSLSDEEEEEGEKVLDCRFLTRPLVEADFFCSVFSAARAFRCWNWNSKYSEKVAGGSPSEGRKGVLIIGVAPTSLTSI